MNDMISIWLNLTADGHLVAGRAMADALQSMSLRALQFGMILFMYLCKAVIFIVLLDFITGVVHSESTASAFGLIEAWRTGRSQGRKGDRRICASKELS